MTGADILEVIVLRRSCSLAQVSHDLVNIYDGRKVRHKAEKLERAGLIELSHGIAKPTERGEEVDAILARITAARGGDFAPRLQSGITGSESTAL